MADTQAKREIRRRRLAVALATAVEGEVIGLAELAAAWGVGKPAFVNVRDTIPDFPAATINGREYLYPRRRALEVLDAWERRADAASSEKAGRLAALVGLQPNENVISLSDLQKANALQISVEERMVAQGMLVPRAQVQATAGKVFQILSRTLTDLSAVVDPNGIFSPEIRTAADKAGQALLLRIHKELKDTLSPDANRTSRPAGKGTRATGVGSAAPRRRRG